MLNLFKKKPQPEPTKPTKVVEVVYRDRGTVSLDEWRGQPGLVARATAILNHKDFEMMMDVMEREHPGNTVMALSVPETPRALLQARCEGYTMALANLRALGVFKQTVSPLEATFEQPEETPELTDNN